MQDRCVTKREQRQLVPFVAAGGARLPLDALVEAFLHEHDG